MKKRKRKKRGEHEHSTRYIKKRLDSNSEREHPKDLGRTACKTIKGDKTREGNTHGHNCFTTKSKHIS